jgi:hypothetical protein
VFIFLPQLMAINRYPYSQPLSLMISTFRPSQWCFFVSYVLVVFSFVFKYYLYSYAFSSLTVLPQCTNRAYERKLIGRLWFNTLPVEITFDIQHATLTLRYSKHSTYNSFVILLSEHRFFLKITNATLT